MDVVPLLVSKDNYAYLLIDKPTKKTAVVDPLGFLTTVKPEADKRGLEIVACLTTHWHLDHSGGNRDFAAHFKGAAEIYGGVEVISTNNPNRLNTMALTKTIKDEDVIEIGDNITIKCIATPCHTQDSICYYVSDKSGASAPVVFTGDTLFIGGSGRYFEGTTIEGDGEGEAGGAEMKAAMQKLADLSPSPVVYSGHEYTAGNLAFARSVDPDNKALEDLQKLADKKMTQGSSTIEDEKRWNVFMRLAIGNSTANKADYNMFTLRKDKDGFKG